MLSKKYSFLMSCLLALLLIMAGCGSNNLADAGSEVKENDGNKNSEEPIILKLATPFPAKSYFTTELFEPFMEKVTSLTDGQVQFEYYPGEQLGKSADTVSIAANGIADISVFAPVFTPSEMPIGATLPGVPGLYETSIQGATAYYNIAQQSPVLEAEFLNNGVRPLSVTMTPFYEIFTNGKEIKVPEDLKGFKQQVAGGIFTEIFKYLGAAPVSIPTSDVYNAFSTGIVDGLHYSYVSVEGLGIGELTKYATRDLKLSAGIYGLIINEEVYQSLPQNVQEVITQVGEEVGKRLTEYMDTESTRVYKDWVESGKITTHELSEDEKQKWQNFYDEFEKYILEKQDSKVFNKALDLFKEEVEKLK